MDDSESAMKRVTGADVARAAGVSKWTVNRAFTPGASIKPESRERVLAAAAELGYRPNLLARSLATNRTMQVAVLVDDFKNPAKLPFLERLSERLQGEGMVMVLININKRHDHIDAIMDIDQRQVDAAILFGTDFKDLQLQNGERLKSQMPLYVLARHSNVVSIPSVSCDSEVAMSEICDYLWQKGYRRPGFMTGPKTLSTALGRRCNFIKCWADRGIENVPVLSAGSYESTAAATVLRTYLSTVGPEERVDVLMCENDALAMGALGIARDELGLSVPGEFAIVGFDDIELVSNPCFDITSYRQPIDEMVEAVIGMISGSMPQGSIALRGELKIRNST
ncbi:LacI family DNA-binding transcriptional regulator [Roseinatronobacter alkalisoli]|uniref:LacI family DNA-binding transcriptional regulator n=1 Tax=Roseinatronobacter alkalisoli TaxID=3028235 RepID=A0ABT5TEP5_9RHOB|nr:LacI family DNA-binding transcriptional regulator [Roseinatronobacter sp. HJB301]MDD7973602.1 LacI family DNA-binding transcriptional regulator [Roseinatronobacter sp. HJB301]